MTVQRALFFGVGLVAVVMRGRAATVTLDTFDNPGATGAVLTAPVATSWIGNVTRNADSITVGGTARDDNGWGATGQNIDATGMTQVNVDALRDAANAAPSLVIQFEDAALRTYNVSVSTASFDTTRKTVPIAINWPSGFDPSHITGWSIGGGTPPTGIAAFRMTFYDLTLSGTIAPPTITIQPQDQAIGVGTGTTMSVTASGVGTLRYQWKKAGVPITGATTSTLAFANVSLDQSALYQVDVTANGGTVTSRDARLTVLDARPTQSLAPGNTGYIAGGTVTIASTLTFGTGATHVLWQVLLPTGWSLASSTGTSGAAGTLGTISWEWTSTSIPSSPIAFTYTLNIPVGSEQDEVITSLLTYGQNGIEGNIMVKSDPLHVFPVGSRHSGDTNGDFRLSLLELTRIIELYNTRHGATRTGAYSLATSASEDGFAAAPERSATPTTLTQYHSADSNRDGLIGLTELMRVIELYNTRSGNTRTGEYHRDDFSEDGFATGP